MNLQSISWLEAAFTLVALFGFLVEISSIHQAYLDYQHLASLKLGGTRRVIAIGKIRNSALRMLIQVIEIAIGVVAMNQLPSNPDRPITLVGIVYSGGLMSIAVIVMLKSLFDRQERMTLMQMQRREGPGRRATDVERLDLERLLERQRRLLGLDAVLREQDAGLRVKDEELREMDKQNREHTRDILNKLEEKTEQIAEKSQLEEEEKHRKEENHPKEEEPTQKAETTAAQKPSGEDLEYS